MHEFTTLAQAAAKQKPAKTSAALTTHWCIAPYHPSWNANLVPEDQWNAEPDVRMAEHVACHQQPPAWINWHSLFPNCTNTQQQQRAASRVLLLAAAWRWQQSETRVLVNFADALKPCTPNRRSRRYAGAWTQQQQQQQAWDSAEQQHWTTAVLNELPLLNQR